MNIVYAIGGATLTDRVQFTKEGGPFVSAAFNGEIGTSGIRIEDPSGTLTINGWQTFTIDDMEATPTRVWTGYIWDKTVGRLGGPSVGVARVHDCDIIDLNALLQLHVLHLNDAKRPAETDAVRVPWLLTSEALSGLVTDEGLVDTSTPVAFLAADLRRLFANAVLSEMGPAAKNGFVYRDTASGNAALFWYADSAAVYSSSLRISNVLSDVDGTTTFAPSLDASVRQEATERYGGVSYGWQGAPIYAQSASTVAAMGLLRDAVYSTDRVGLLATAENQAAAFLNSHAGERDRITVTVLLPSAAVNLLYAGMRMEVKFTHLPGFTSFTWTRVRRKSFRPVGVDVDGTWTVLWEVNLELWVPPVPIDDAAVPECATIVQTVAKDYSSVSFPVIDGADGWVAPTPGNHLVCLITRRGAFDGTQLFPHNSGDTEDFELDAVAATVGMAAGDTDHVAVIGIRVANGNETAMGWDHTQMSVTMHEVAGGDWSVLETQREAGTFGTHALLPSIGSAGQLCFALFISETRFPGYVEPVADAPWSVDYAHGSNVVGGAVSEPFVMYLHGTGPIVPGEVLEPTGTDWGGMAFAIGGCEEPLPVLGDPIGPETPTGTVDNSNTDFTTAGPFLAGTLRVLHDGIDQTAHVTTSDPVAGTFTLDYAPEFGATMRTVYESA